MQIEKDVPIPTRGAPRGPRTEATRLAEKMQPGDSVLVETEAIATSMTAFGRARGLKMTQRKTGEGWRVWRLG